MVSLHEADGIKLCSWILRFWKTASVGCWPDHPKRARQIAHDTGGEAYTWCRWCHWGRIPAGEQELSHARDLRSEKRKSWRVQCLSSARPQPVDSIVSQCNWSDDICLLCRCSKHLFIRSHGVPTRLVHGGDTAWKTISAVYSQLIDSILGRQLHRILSWTRNRACVSYDDARHGLDALEPGESQSLRTTNTGRVYDTSECSHVDERFASKHRNCQR